MMGGMGETKTDEHIGYLAARWHFQPAVGWFAASLALSVRLMLFPYVSGDAHYFLLPWMQEFREHGAAALGGEFSNYNFPYLLLMYLGSLLPLEPLFAIKTISLAGDGLLAFSLAAVVAQLRPGRVAPRLVGMLALFLPTVLLNASMWGQCDSFYTAFLLLSLRNLLRSDGRGAWLWWAVALSFKLQSMFFLPALLLVSMRNGFSMVLPGMSAALWAFLSLPPVLFGRSLASALSIYMNQTKDDRLIAGAANVYAWFPNVSVEQGRIPALFVCGCALLLTAVAYWRGPDSPERRALLAVTAVAVCPLLLPQMHDRYFFAAEVMSLLLVRHRRLFLVPWLFAAAGLYAYALFFVGNQNVLPLIPASIVTFMAAAALFHCLWQADTTRSNLAIFSR